MNYYDCCICGKECKDYEPIFCCGGTIQDECGCMGQPLDPPLCSEECGKRLYGGNK